MGALAEDWEHGGFGLYVHWPFCAAKCPYCDFNSHVAATIDHLAWRDAYVAEINRTARLLPGRRLKSIYFGGGTPSLMEAETVDAIINAAQRSWHFDNDIEITLEANPGSVEAAKFGDFRASGVNRVSIGVQALKDADLKRLGRIHSVAEARAAIEVAQTCFDRVSFDLIYGRQDQSLQAWLSELEDALAIGADHLSLYQLTVEDGTPFAQRQAAGGLRGLPDEALSADLFEATEAMCSGHGLQRYEVSNFARPGQQSTHNLIYWRYGDYAGVGPGAHGRITLDGHRHASAAWRNPQKWLTAVSEGNGDEVLEKLSGMDQAEECLMMGLRTVEGVSMDRLARLSGTGLTSSGVQKLVDLGAIGIDGGVIIVKKQYVSLLNSVLGELMFDQ